MRASRPPGFEMSYRPLEPVYGAPFAERVPSLLYLVVAACILVLVVVGEHGAPGSWLHSFVVTQDRTRLVGARTFSALLLLGAVSSVARGSMRGVRVSGDGLEARDIAYGLWPRVRRYRWPEVERLSVAAPGIVVRLWDGRRAMLPRVADREGLVAALEVAAAVRAIPLKGGRGLDEIPERVDREKQAQGDKES